MNIKGFTYAWDAKVGMLKNTAKVDKSISRLKEDGCNWLCFPVCMVQDKFCSTTFGFDFRRCVTDKEVTMTINAIHEKGMKVCLKPMVNCKDGTWRALINFPDESHFASKADAYWDEWFSCYTAYICHYAEIAEDTGCEMLCIGCEMLGTEKKSIGENLSLKFVKFIAVLLLITLTTVTKMTLLGGMLSIISALLLTSELLKNPMILLRV